VGNQTIDGIDFHIVNQKRKCWFWV